MRKYLVLVACVIAVGLAAGCSDDDCSPCAPAVLEQPLAQITIAGGIGGATSTNTLRICYVSSSADTLFHILITEADEGTSRTFDATSYPPFADAAARLSDGVNDDWTFWAFLYPTSGGGGWGNNEANLLNGGFTGEYDPDLAGAKITKARLILDRVDIVQEPSYTSCDITVRIVLIGKP